jgi:hypothetical protein
MSESDDHGMRNRTDQARDEDEATGAYDWTERPCQPMMHGCTGAPHRPDCPYRIALYGVGAPRR